MMKMIPISDCCKVVSGATPRRDTERYWGGDIPWVTPKELSNLSNPVLYETVECITEEGLASCSAQMLPENAILFSSRAPIGHIAIVGQPMCTNQGFKSLIPNEHTDSRYLYHCLQHMKPALVNQGRGATFKEINKEIMEKFNIPIPYSDDVKKSLAEQRQIAGILDKADSIRKKRRESLALADEFLTSAFLDIFGDPVINPKKWSMEPLGEICDVRDGTHDSPKYLGQGYPLITSKNVKNGFIDFSDVNYISKIDYIKINKRSKVDLGDIIMPMIGTIGNPIIVEEERPFAIKNVALIKFTKTSISKRYILALLKSHYFKHCTKDINRGGTQKFISLGDIRSLPVPVPPIDLQNRFAEIVKKQRAMVSRAQIAAEEADNLFNSLVQRAFKGEL